MVFKTLCIFGTRPEAIKMAPVIKQLKAVPAIQNKVCVTGQHRQMLDSVLESFKIVPDFNLDVMTGRQSLSALTAKILTKLDAVYKEFKPHLVLVHGDTTTTLAASLSAYYHHIPIAHVESGLRTKNLNSPWPEEGNRKLTGALASIHFAPTVSAQENLLFEGVPIESIHVTGNTVIDALFEMARSLSSDPKLTYQLQQEFSYLKSDRKLILVTGHRRENFGQGFKEICGALATIARSYDDVDIVYPVHLNPQVQEPVNALLGGMENLYLIPPVGYLPFIYLMKASYLILTDSGGIQEEAPSLGKPVLVMRNVTERPEAVAAGTVKLVGTAVNSIVTHVNQLLTDEAMYQRMSQAQNPYGDGNAAARIVEIIVKTISEAYPKE
jgi:UDP-N-acetylglucosamine 2-epimerase (non-hydrolysing)